MLNLLQFEFRRLFRKTSFYVCLAIIGLLVLYAIGIVAQQYSYTERYLSSTPVNPQITTILFYTMRFANLSVMAGVFSALYICEDRVKGTIKTIYSLGYSRVHVFFAKYLASAFAVTLMYALMILLSLIGGILLHADFSSQYTQSSSILYNDESTKQISILVIIIQQYFSIMALHSFYYMISEFFGNTGPAIVLNIFSPLLIYIAFMMIISAYTSFMQNFGDKKIITEATGAIVQVFTMYWLPTMITFFVDLAGGFANMDYGISIAVNICYIILFGALALLITQKKQVKN